MNARPSILALILSALSLGASELHWQNGEWLGGHFVGAEDGHVTWRSPMFSEDFEVRIDALRRINRFKTDSKTDEPFSIHLADGSCLYGSITGLDAKTLRIKSARAGSFQVLRDTIVSIHHLKVPDAPLPALAGTSGWTEPPSPNHSSTSQKLWRMVPGASLQQVGWNRSASLPLQLPEKLEMQIRLRSSVRPEFKIELSAPGAQRMVVETWIDDVVLQGRIFEKLQTLGDNDHRLELTLFWNRTTGLCAVYDSKGRKIFETSKPPVNETRQQPEKKAAAKQPQKEKAEEGGGIFGALLGVVKEAAQARIEAMQQPRETPAADEESPASPGVTLLNKGPDLTLEDLRIRSWDGSLPSDIITSRPQIALTDGRILKASPVRADSDSVTVRGQGGKETRLPWDKVLALELVTESSPFHQAAPPLTEMWFTDGEWINGTLLHVRNEVASFKTTFSEEPVHFKISALHHLDFSGFKSPAEDKTDLASLDKLTISKNSLHGTLDAGGEAQPRWKPVGGLKPVPLVTAGEIEITRAAPAEPAVTSTDALFYLQDGDVLPGKLRAIDSRQIDLDSQFSSIRHLPAERLMAIQFGGESLKLEGFEDPGWQQVRGDSKTVTRKGKDAIDFEPGGSWGHPSFMQVHELSFLLHNNSFSALRLRLFCDGFSTTSPSTNLLFAHMGSEVCFGLESSGNQMDRQFRIRTKAAMPVRIAVAENAVEVFFNGVSARKITLSTKMRSGLGLVLEPFNLWGNGERKVSISSFTARITPGRVAAPVVNSLAREHALTVPRFRKEDPPRHALLAANGDILRGVIEAATADHFAVRSGLENIQVPRDRVKAAVWLVKPFDDINAAFEARDKEQSPPLITHWLLLNNGGRLGLKVTRFAEDSVFGTSPLLGECHVPLPQIHGIRSTTPPDSSAMLALRDWKLKFAPEPVLPESGGQSSPLLNQEAKPFKLPLLSGGDFDLSQEKGKVIVLDFWATWCGPCIKSLPQLIDSMSPFDSKLVRFIGVNQAEDKETVKAFLETRGWTFEVALDAAQRVGQSFGVEGIPHTVVIGPDGRIAYIKTGYESDGAEKIAQAVKKLLKK
ncbi:TlpA family protein disulfide reductase [Prosthecobacter vanneervenii]|uniref:Thiol-disulfide isomerase/thioredoxin n=1 Tax=Prosthecobacter vanneervenii TaxID=48466 RepID=A0A7W7YDV4_9BACT|nr:TlpA disulfide reductase family protein [Prosthecobacter vanneervenii]MBB5034212.1 thiol-disulfide isomerase/thioredoxin [Prosthecobacter vanneervenii]